MKKNSGNILSEIDKITFDMEKEIKRNTELLFSDEEYSIAIDIVNRSRELATLYLKAKDRKRAIEILRITIDFSYTIEGLALDDIAKDVELAIKLYRQQNGKKHIIELLKIMIERYPDYSCVSMWEDQLEQYQNKTK